MTMNKPAGSPDWIDPDEAPVLTAAEAQSVEVFHGDAFVRRGRGRPKTGQAKELVSLRLDQDVIARLRAAGPGWQSRVNFLLRLGLDAPDALHAAPSKMAAQDAIVQDRPKMAAALQSRHQNKPSRGKAKSAETQ